MRKFIRCDSFLIDPETIYSVEQDNDVIRIELIDPLDDQGDSSGPNTNTLIIVSHKDMVNSPFFSKFHDEFTNFVQIPKAIPALPHVTDDTTSVNTIKFKVQG